MANDFIGVAAFRAGGITFGNGQIAIALLLYNWLHPAP